MSRSETPIVERMSGLRLLLDTANVAWMEQWWPTGLFYGVTTNPLLLERSQVPCHLTDLTQLAQAALALGYQEVQVQTWGSEVEELVKRGRALGEIDPRIVVKVPATRSGTIAATQLIAAGLRVTLTAVYTEHQALIAAAIGADYAAPYLGRIQDEGRDGHGAIATMQQALRGVNSPMRLLVASLRQPADLTILATQGLNTFTLAPAIADQLFEVPQTLAAAAAFEAAVRSNIKIEATP